METDTITDLTGLHTSEITSVAPRAPRVSDAMLLTGTQAAKWLLRGVFVLILARALGPAEFGVYALLYAMVEFLAVASGTGYADYLTREAAKDARVGWGLAFQLMVLRIAIAIPVVIIEIAVLSVLRYPHRVLAGTAWLALTLIPRSLSEAVQGVLRGIDRYKSYLAIEVTLGAGLVAGGGLLLVRNGGLRIAVQTEIAAAGIAGLLAVGLGLRFKTRETIGLKGSMLLKKSAVFNLYSFIGSLYDRFDVVLLSRLAGDYPTGIYSVAYRALGMTQILAYGVLYSLLPSLSRNATGPEERRRMEKAIGLLLSAAFVLVLGAMVFAGPVVRLLLGVRYAESAVALKVLIWAVILRYVNYALNIELLAAGLERVFVMTTLVCLTVNFVGNLIFIPMFSWRAAAAMTITTELVLLGQNVFWVKRTRRGVSLSWGMARNSLVFVFLLALAMAGGYFGAPLAVGTACIAIFATYLYYSGIYSEFLTVWSAERGPAA